MKKLLFFILKFICLLYGSIFYLGSLGGLILCFTDKVNPLAFNIIFTIILFALGTLLFHIALKKLNSKNIVSPVNDTTTNSATDISAPNASSTIQNTVDTEQLKVAQKILNTSVKPLNEGFLSEDVMKTKDSPILKTDNLKLWTSSDDEYDAIVLPNPNTVGKQKENDLNIAIGIYPTETSNYLGMKIVSNTVPPQENYNVLNDQEMKFFKAFHDQLIQEKFSPSKVKLCRLSNGCFNVDYIGLCHVGKINLYEPPVQYAVIKNGNKRATKIFSSLQEADEFITEKSDYMIQERKEKTSTYMQYFIGLYSVKELHGLNADQYIEFIIRWIRYLKYCKRN